MTAINMATLPAYYYLYALYFDYIINKQFHAGLEDEARIREALRKIRGAVQLTQPYRMTWALRLFTEREALNRFPPELVSEAWRQLRELVDRIGPPRGWQGKLIPKPAPHGRPRPRSPQEPPARPYRPPFPRPPVVYDFTA
jgi:hypothetical protein